MDSNPAGLAALSGEYTLGGHPTHRGMTTGRQSKKAATCKLRVVSAETNSARTSILDFQPPKPQRTESTVLEAASLWYSTH